MNVAWRIPLVLVLALGANVRAQEARGFGELRMSLFPGAVGQKLQVTERVRPTFESKLHERIKLVGTIEAALTEGRDLSGEFENALRHSDLGPLLEASGCCSRSFRNETFRIDRAGDYLDVDRLYVDAYLGRLDARIGRQALSWGSAQFFNPTDPFPQVLFTEPWRARRGVNAARFNIPFSKAHDFTAVAAVSDALNELRAAGRLRVNFSGTDFALVGAWRGKDRGLIGLDLRGTFGVGWWVEGAYLTSTPRHEEIAVGIDYSFRFLERTTAFAQYYRNGAGSTNPRGIMGSALLAAVSGPVCATGSLPLCGSERDPFAPFTSGRDYLLVGTTLLVLPELSASLAGLQNLNDGSGLLVPTIQYNALDWLDVALSAQVPYALGAQGGELKPRREDLILALPGPTGTLSADLSGLLPAATITFWTRAGF